MVVFKKWKRSIFLWARPFCQPVTGEKFSPKKNFFFVFLNWKWYTNCTYSMSHTRNQHTRPRAGRTWNPSALYHGHRRDTDIDFLNCHGHGHDRDMRHVAKVRHETWSCHEILPKVGRGKSETHVSAKLWLYQLIFTKFKYKSFFSSVY